MPDQIQLPQQLVRSALGAADLVVTFGSTITPPVSLDVSGAATAPPSPPNPLAGALMGLLRPTVTVRSRLGAQTYAPWGSASGGFAPVAAGVLVLGFGLAAYGAWCLVRRR